MLAEDTSHPKRQPILFKRTKYKRQKERQRVREGVLKEEKLPYSRKPSHRWVCVEFWDLRGQHNWEKKIKPTEYSSNSNCQQRNSPDARVRYQRAGAGQEARAA